MSRYPLVILNLYIYPRSFFAIVFGCGYGPWFSKIVCHFLYLFALYRIIFLVCVSIVTRLLRNGVLILLNSYHLLLPEVPSIIILFGGILWHGGGRYLNACVGRCFVFSAKVAVYLIIFDRFLSQLLNIFIFRLLLLLVLRWVEVLHSLELHLVVTQDSIHFVDLRHTTASPILVHFIIMIVVLLVEIICLVLLGVNERLEPFLFHPALTG
jgi:hypothetical protein